MFYKSLDPPELKSVFNHITITSRLHHDYITITSRLHHNYITITSRLHHDCITITSRLHHDYTAITPRLHRKHNRTLNAQRRTPNNLIIQEYTQDRQRHAGHVGRSHRIAEGRERQRNDDDAFRRIGNGIRERRNQSDERERDNVLSESAETVDDEQRHQPLGVCTLELR